MLQSSSGSRLLGGLTVSRVWQPGFGSQQEKVDDWQLITHSGRESRESVQLTKVELKGQRSTQDWGRRAG